MAANISYKINGKADTKPLSQIQNGINKISKAAKAMNLAIGGLVVGKVIQGINKVVNGSTEAFISQNKAATLANKAFASNTKLTSQSIKNIKTAMNSFSMNNLIDGDTLNNAAQLASSMGLNETQIINVMDAASELSSAGIMPMNEAVKKLSESYSGNLGELKKLSPELANLTKEELENGKAVELIKSKYDGFRETMAASFDGRETQFKNVFGDLQASVGGVIQSLKFLGEGALMPKLQDLTDYIEKHRKQIINFFINLPEIATVAITTLKDIVVRTLDNMPDLGSFLIGTLGNWFPVLKSGLETIGTIILGLLDVTFGNIGRLFYNKVILTIKKALDNAINNFVSKHPKIAVVLGIEKSNNADYNEVKYANFSDYTEKASQTFSQAVANAKTAVEAQRKTNEQFTKNYKDITAKATKEISSIVNKDLPEELQKALDGANGNTNSGSNNNEDSDTANNYIDDLKSFAGGIGQIGAAAKAVASSNWIGLIIQFLSALNTSMTNASESYAKVVNLFSTIADAVSKIARSDVEKTLKPFADGLEVIGHAIGKVLSVVLELGNWLFSDMFSALTNVLSCIGKIIEAIAPLIGFILKIISLVLMIKPAIAVLTYALNTFAKFIYKIAQFIASIAEHVANFFVALWNAVVGIFKKISLPTGISIGWSGISVKWKSLATMMDMKEADTVRIDLDDPTEESESSSSASNVSGGSASYTAAKDVYVNIYFSNSFVNGDAQEIAIMLEKEIRRAEAKNLV